MLMAVERRGQAIAVVAANRARARVAGALREALPGVAVEIVGDDVVLVGRVRADDQRLRWIGSLLR